MTEPFLPLTPDEDEQATPILGGEPDEPEQPYSLVAVMIGMALLLIGHGIFPTWPFSLLFYSTALVAVATYIGLLVARPRLPLRVLAVFAAELGLFYSLPAKAIYGKSLWHAPSAFLTLVALVLGAGILGVLVGRGFMVERWPRAVIPAGFLLVFVIVNMRIFF